MANGISMEENQSLLALMMMETFTTLRRNQELLHWAGAKLPVVMLQYVYNGDPEDIKVEPHKNAKKVCQTFLWNSKEHTRKNMREGEDSSGTIIDL